MKNKIYALRFRAVDRDIFEAIKSGKKKIETRAAIANYRKIGRGDTIVFVCGQKKIKKEVAQAELYKTIGALFKHYKIKDIFPSLATISEVRRTYYSFPNYREKLKKYGLIAWRIK